MLAGFLTVACATGAPPRVERPSEGEPCPSAAPRAAPATVTPVPLAGDLYLDPADAHGSPYCLNPASTKLRELLQARPFPADKQLSRQALAEDIRYLHRLFEKVYAGYPELLQHRTFDVKAFFAEWASELESEPGSIDFESGFLRRIAALKRVVRDNHLQPQGWGLKLSSRPALKITEFVGAGEVPLDQCELPLGSLGHTLRLAKELLADGTQRTVTALSVQGPAPQSLDLQCGDETLKLTPRMPVDRREDAPVYEWKSVGATAVLTVRRLWGSPGEVEDLERIKRDYPSHRRHRRIVWDFRGNGGGNDAHIYQWINQAKRGVYHVHVSVEVFGALAPCNEYNWRVADQVRFDVADNPKSIAERERMIESWPAFVPPVQHRVFSGKDEPSAKHPYTGTVVVLLDRYSGSSGESGPYALQAALGARLVGERTGGYLAYGNLKSFPLPYTGIVMKVPTKRNYYPFEPEAVGLPVDVYLSEELLAKNAQELVPLLDKL